ncbi:MAG: NAD(P)/FAD-dependent oxidoreductase, partial [Phycisphaerales bacterium]|nr:NAD(P)/FAD-dependent oxidoreductase [Phycisphaerales bacterium]
VGGCAGSMPRLGDLLTTGLDDDALKNTVTTLIAFYQATAKPGERIGRMINRIGLDALKAGVGLA